MLLVVKRVGELHQVAEYPVRNVGEALRAGRGVEGMQHAVVRPDVDDRRAIGVRGGEGEVGGGLREPVWRTDVQRGAGDDVAELVRAVAERPTVALLLRVAAAKVL